MNENPSLLKFLLIDDDDDHARIVTRSLRKERIENSIVRFPDGVEALKYLRREGQYAGASRPGVILLDLKLPKMDGHQVLAEIKADKELMEIPVVILTTSDAETDRCKAYTLHANSYLVKPIDVQSFRKMVQDLSLYWGVWNTPPKAVNES